MWFATHDGLNKYDGYDFTVYQHDEQNPYSIGSDITRACMSDSQGNIWIGTQEGLSLYDATQDKFYNYTYPKNKANTPINGMVEINENQLLLFAGKDENLCGSIPEPADFRYPAAPFASIHITYRYQQTRRQYIHRKL